MRYASTQQIFIDDHVQTIDIFTHCRLINNPESIYVMRDMQNS